MEGTRRLGNAEWTKGEVVDKKGAGVVEGEEGAWEGRLYEEIGRERIDVPVVQKPPSEVAATADEEGALTGASASGVEGVEVGALQGEGREQETSGGMGDGSRERGKKDGMR